MKKKNKVENKKVLKTKKSLKQKFPIITFNCSNFKNCSFKVTQRTINIKIK